MPNGYPLHKYHQDATEEALLISQIGEPVFRWAYSTHSNLVAVFIYVCLSVKNIGKPCAGKPQARFDEGGLAKEHGQAIEALSNERDRNRYAGPKL